MASRWSWFGKLLSEELPAEAIHLAVSEWISGRRREGGKDSPAVDKRGDVLASLLAVEGLHGRMKNIWRHRDEWASRCQENKFWMLLWKVPRVARCFVYPALNAMSDGQFGAAMDELDHDAFRQFCQRVYNYASPAFRQAWDWVQTRLNQTGGAIHDYAGQVEASHRRRHEEEEWGMRPSPGRGLRRALLWGILVPIIFFGLFLLIAFFA